jgi:hypothetical protein
VVEDEPIELTDIVSQQSRLPTTSGSSPDRIRVEITKIDVPFHQILWLVTQILIALIPAVLAAILLMTVDISAVDDSTTAVKITYARHRYMSDNVRDCVPGKPTHYGP